MGKKSSAPAPAPDPMIGQAAYQNVQLGKDWLEESKKQYADGLIRQDKEDALAGKVVDSALASQAQADKWAVEDRGIAADYRQKFDGWANEDRQLGRDTMKGLDALGTKAQSDAAQYKAFFDKEAEAQSGFGTEERDRYKSIFRPVQDKVASDAMNWDSDARLEAESAKAKADVVDGAAQQRAANARSMASMGINPASGRFQGVERATDTATALAAAGAQNATRDNVRQQAVGMRTGAAQLGQQVLGNGQQATSLGMQASGAGHSAAMAGDTLAMNAKTAGLAAAGVGNTAAAMGAGQQGAGYAGLGLGLNAGGAAMGANGAANGNFYQTNGILGSGYSGAIGANQSAGNMLNTQYGNQLQGWGMQQQANGMASGGIGSMIGTIAGAGITAF